MNFDVTRFNNLFMGVDFSKGGDISCISHICNGRGKSLLEECGFIKDYDVSSLYWSITPHFIINNDYERRLKTSNNNVSKFKKQEIPSNTAKTVYKTPSWSLLNKI